MNEKLQAVKMSLEEQIKFSNRQMVADIKRMAEYATNAELKAETGDLYGAYRALEWVEHFTKSVKETEKQVQELHNRIYLLEALED